MLIELLKLKKNNNKKNNNNNDYILNKPIICCCNNQYSKNLRNLKKMAQIFIFKE